MNTRRDFLRTGARAGLLGPAPRPVFDSRVLARHSAGEIRAGVPVSWVAHRPTEVLEIRRVDKAGSDADTH